MSSRTTLARRALASTAALAIAAAPLLSHAGPDAAPPSPSYTLTLLAPLDGGYASSANGLNDEGDVVGTTRPNKTAQPQEAALWHAGEEKPHALAQLPDSQFARAFDIGADGTVAGEAFNAAGSSLPVAWAAGIAALPSPNAEGLGVAWDVADDGTVLATANDGTRSVTYTTDGQQVTKLPEPTVDGATTGDYRAKAISDNGRFAAGTATVAVPHGDHSHDERFLAIWHDDHVHVYKPTDKNHFNVNGINDGGVAVGDVSIDGRTVAARWAKGIRSELPSVGLSEFPHSSAAAVGHDDVIVGSATKFAGNASFGGAAVAWFGEDAVDLNTLVDAPEGVNLLAANDINDRGQIVGTAQTPEGQRGFLLTPLPQDDDPVEPSPSEEHPSAPAEEATQPSEQPSEHDHDSDEDHAPRPEPTAKAPAQTPGLPKTGN